MSNLSTDQRNKLPASAFCGPNRTYPILDQSDVNDAARLIGKASPSAQARIKACILRKCRTHGWKPPQAWTEGS